MANIRIVIVNWNSGLLLQQCLGSIADAASELTGTVEVVVVDNASTDGPFSTPRMPSNVVLNVETNSSNVGFAKACNQGARGSGTDYLLFLNPDTQLDSRALGDALAAMESPANSGFGVCGIQLRDKDGGISKSCGRIPTLPMLLARTIGVDRTLGAPWANYTMIEWDHLSSSPVDHISGAFYLIRTELFRRLGGFDERFFVYFEDIDLSLRVRASGASILFLSTAVALHVGGGSSSRAIGRRIYYNARSRILFTFKHHGWIGGLTIAFAALFIESAIRLCHSALAPRERLPEVLSAFGHLWKDIPGIVCDSVKPRT